MKNVGTPYELSPVPRLYQDYVGHDNNRDAYMLNMIESRVIEHTWRQWEPDIIYVQHQSGPFPTRIWLPPFSEPVGIDAPYLMSREVNMMGMAIAKGLEEHGQVGATHMGTAFDAWYPGLRGLRAELQEHPGVLDRDRALPVRDAARIHARGFPRGHARPPAAQPVLEPVAARLVAPRRRGRLHGDGVDVGARVGVEVQGVAALRSLSGGPRSDRPRKEEAAVRVLHSAGPARSGRRRRAAAPPRLRRRARVRSSRSR